jgi:hypothetical protein
VGGRRCESVWCAYAGWAARAWFSARRRLGSRLNQNHGRGGGRGPPLPRAFFLALSSGFHPGAFLGLSSWRLPRAFFLALSSGFLPGAFLGLSSWRFPRDAFLGMQYREGRGTGSASRYSGTGKRQAFLGHPQVFTSSVLGGLTSSRISCLLPNWVKGKNWVRGRIKASCVYESSLCVSTWWPDVQSCPQRHVSAVRNRLPHAVRNRP